VIVNDLRGDKLERFGFDFIKKTNIKAPLMMFS
jgi:hypothetical protein